jgi:hypothetical protein
MLSRRSLFAGVAALAVTASPALAQEDPYRVAFERLSEQERRSFQVEVQMAGLYSGPIDGAFGPGTKRAMMAAPQFIVDNSYARYTFSINNIDEMEDFLRDVAAGKYSVWLYGEGEEGMNGF